MKLASLAAGIVVCAVGHGWGQQVAEPVTPRVVLVELFTSEGCSSCPPADALLKRLNGLRAGAGPTVVAISEHVTYWNHGGWTDPFSAELYTDRQRAYASRFGLDNVYTPQMVINGQQQTVGAETQEIVRAVNQDIRQDEGASPVRVRIDAATAGEKKIAVSYRVSGQVPGRAEVWAVVVDDVASSNVLHGENSGRALEHVNVARGLTKVGRAVSEQAVTVSLDNPERIKGQGSTGRHLVLFVQAAGLGKVLAVESLPLRAEDKQTGNGSLM